MIVYGEREERVATLPYLREIIAVPDPEEQIIRFGQFESAVVDEVCRTADDITPLTRACREAALTRNYSRMCEYSLPSEVRIRPAEGFAWYAVYPEMYTLAAREFLRECRPAACTIAGIRSIGATLSTVVEEAILKERCPAWSFTVRPRGQPFDRSLKLSDPLRTAILLHSSDYFLIVDEGPGLSGTSFICVAEELIRLGVPEKKIVFFPSHDPDPDAFVSERSRLRWSRHRRWFQSFQAERYMPPDVLDLSGGQWRTIVNSDVSVVAQHERRKYLSENSGVLWKWAGLAHYGRALEQRAAELAEAGFAPAPRSLHCGFLGMDWVPGQRANSLDPDLLDTIARYLTHLAGSYPAGPVEYGRLAEMIQINCGIECRSSNPVIEEGCTVRGDGRMLPHEWVRASDRWLKTDALDHHDDHFFPGCQDIAWDIAGTTVEFGVEPEVMIAPYLRLRKDPTLRARALFYRLAYSAYRLGYATLAKSMASDPAESAKWETLRLRYQVIADSAANQRPAHRLSSA